MKKQSLAFLLALVLAITAIPAMSLAAAKQMRDDVPVWTEETVKEYALAYISGQKFYTLWGYYDLQIRRYMPMDTYEAMLTEKQWLTGEFIEFGTYTSFEEASQKTKTHVLHLCMEKQDLDLYFTHKDKEDDWEVMAVEFALADKQAISDGRDMLVVGDDEDYASASQKNLPAYTEQEVTVGDAPYQLKGILTLPEGASASAKVPACVLVHGSGPNDMDESVGQTKLFADLASAFAEQGIATLRYDKRTYTYGTSMTQEEIANITVEEETIQDAIAAGKILQDNECVDASRIVLVGHSMGAMLAPRIATEANGMFGGLLMIAGTPKTLLQIMIAQNQDAIAKMDAAARTGYLEQLAPIVAQSEKLAKMSEADARTETIFGVNAYYFWEMEQHDPIKLIKKLKVPIYIVQGNEDFQVTVENGVEAYEDQLGDDLDNVNYKAYRGLNHLLMEYKGDGSVKGTVQEYDTPATLDTVAARDMAAWINSIGKKAEEDE